MTFLTIVVPVYNEQENLAALVGEIEACLPTIPGEVEVIAVDDGSRDRSWALLQELASPRPWLRALRFLNNRGQTAAMAAGIAAASGEFIAFLDADLQNDPRDIARMLEPIQRGEADVVCGWRQRRQDNAVTRTLPSRIANWMIRRSLRSQLHDVGCTLKVFRRAYIEDVNLFGEMHRFLPSFASDQGARIIEVPVSHRPRHAGVSKYGFERVGKVLIDLLTVKMLNQYGASPAYLFGKIALLFFALGTVAFGVVAYRVLILKRLESTPLIFIMTILYMTGVMALLSGLLAELNVRVLHHVGGRRSYKVVEKVGFGEPGGTD
jgi:glycosyltransferase involved in cell wall biosynthesis